MKKSRNSGATAGCAPPPGSPTPFMDAAAYEATPRTVGKWIVPLAKAREMERKCNDAREHNAWMLEVARAAGFDSITAAIVAARKWSESQSPENRELSQPRSDHNTPSATTKP